MTELKIIATIELKEEFKSELIPVLEKVVTETRKEVGVVSYDLHQDVDNPLKYVILEVWSTKEAIDDHNQTPHFREFVKALDGKIENLSINVMKKIF